MVSSQGINRLIAAGRRDDREGTYEVPDKEPLMR
jgi:hypothetical protein